MDKLWAPWRINYVNKPQGHGLASVSQSHKPQGYGLPSNRQSQKPQGHGLPSSSQSQKPQGHGLASASQSHSKQRKGCIFCRAGTGKSKDYVIFKTQFSIVMLNIYPYNNGHMLIAPLRHIRDISQMQENEILDLFKCLNKAKSLLQKVLKPQGYNIGFNLSRVAGAGIAGHLHLHIVPRWVGDTNFMPVIFETKIISQSLNQLAKELKYANR